MFAYLYYVYECTCILYNLGAILIIVIHMNMNKYQYIHTYIIGGLPVNIDLISCSGFIGIRYCHGFHLKTFMPLL